MSYFKFPFFLISVLLIGNIVHAENNDPKAVAREYFHVLQNEGLTSIGRFMHPEALSDFKEMALPVYEFEAELGQRQLMDATFGRLNNISDLRDMEPSVFMNGFISLVAAQVGGSKLHFDKMDILGVVEEGKFRHVLTRITIGVGELAITQFEVLSFVPYKGNWYLQLNAEIQGIAKTLRESISIQ